MAAEAEQLRIVDAKTWQLVQERIGTRAGTPHKAWAAHLLSGLLKCGCCGLGYVGHGSDKRGTLLACSRMKETGLCENKKRVAREQILDSQQPFRVTKRSRSGIQLKYTTCYRIVVLSFSCGFVFAVCPVAAGRSTASPSTGSSASDLSTEALSCAIQV
jgi:Recombinase zinc beta ribbon domain